LTATGRASAAHRLPSAAGDKPAGWGGPCGRSAVRVAHDRGLCGVGRGSSRSGTAVNAENLVGLVLAVALVVFLVVALLFPERFW